MINTTTLNEPAVLKSALESTDTFALWATLLPLVEYMSDSQQKILAELLMAERDDLQVRFLEAAYQHHLWQPLFDIIRILSDEQQHKISVRFKQLAAKEPHLVEKWQPIAIERGLSHLV